MASFKSALVTVARGSLGGITFTANQYQSLIMRERVIPVDPRTNYQIDMRSAMSNSVAKWKQITETQRQGWEDYASTLTISKPTGDHTPTGREAFLQVVNARNWLASQVGGIVDSWEPPVNAGFAILDNITVGSVPGSGLTGFRITGYQSSDELMTFYASHSFAFDLTRNSYQGPFLPATLQKNTTNVELPLDFIGLIADRAYFVRVRGLGFSAGAYRITSPKVIRAVATTTP